MQFFFRGELVTVFLKQFFFPCLFSPLLRNGSTELTLPREMLDRLHMKKSDLSLFPGQNCSPQYTSYPLSKELKHANRRKVC